MKRTLMLAVTLTMVMAMGTVAMAQNGIYEDYESGNNNGGWAWSGSDTIEPTGGNDGGYLQSMNMDVPTPTLRGEYDSEGWNGNFTAMGVTGFSADLMTLSTDNAWWSYFPCYVMIVNYMGTPDNPYDDVYVYPTPEMYAPPAVGAGWINYSWNIPSDFVGGAAELPEGWHGGVDGTTTFPADMTWQDMMTNVGRLEIRTLQPDYMASFQNYQMGVDNLKLFYESGTVATESTTFSSLKAMYR